MSALDTLTAKVHGLRSWLVDPPEMPLVCEIACDYVAAVRQRRGQVEAWAARKLPPGAVRPGPLSDNIADPAAVQPALEEVIGAVDGAVRHCAVIVPDLLARVSLFEVDQLPGRAAEVEGLVRWRLSQDLSFELEQAQLSFQLQKTAGGKDEVLATVCLQHLLRQYEERLKTFRIEPGFVTPSLLAALGWFPEDDTPRILIKRTPVSLSLAVAERNAIRLFRSVPLPPPSPDRPPGSGLFEKIYPALVYFKEQAGRPVEEAHLCGLGAEEKELQSRLESEAGCKVERLSVDGLELPPPALEGESDPAWLLPSLGWVRMQEP